MRTRLFHAAAVVLGIFPLSAVHAGETTTYTYDSLGRVVSVSKSGGPANGVQASYTYDHAGNRSNVTVINSPNGNGNGSGNGASVDTTPLYVVVPLNGYTLIRIR